MVHVQIQSANIEPVFFAYPDNAEIDAIMFRYIARVPEYDFIADEDGFGHKLWVIDDQKDIDRITEIFASIPAFYVADGHHRTAAAARVGAERRAKNPNHTGNEEYNYFMAKRKRRLDSLEAAQGAPRDPRRDSRGERSPWLPLETRPDSPGEPGMHKAVKPEVKVRFR